MAASNRPEGARQEYESASADTHIRFPNSPHPHSILLVFEEYDYKNFDSYSNTLSNNVDGKISANRQSGVGLRSANSIELPFPKQLVDNASLIVNGFGQDPMMSKVAEAVANFATDGTGAGTVNDIPKAIQNFGAALATAGTGGNIMGSIRDMTSALGATTTKEAALMSKYLLSKISSTMGDVGKSVNLALGEVINPRETLAFEGVELRTHSFTWDLYPSNPKDSAMIQSIIRTVKRSVLPVTKNLGTAGELGFIGEAFLKYPNICKMYLIGIDQNYYMKFKPCMVKSVSVDYGAGGTLGIMQGGRPAGVSLSMQFQELQIETANDYGASPAPQSQTDVDGLSLPPTNRTEQEGI